MDRDRIDAFLDRFVGYASGATTMGLLSIADRIGLLAWMGDHQTGTVEEIAAGADIDERYTREILSGLAASGAIDYDPESRAFTMSPEHALFLADQNSPYFMGGWYDMIPAVMTQIDAVAEAAKDGGGVPFPDFGDGMIRGIDRGNSPSQRVFLVRRWLPAVPELVERLEAGLRVADVGCGTGTAAIAMAQAFPASQVFGFDVSDESLDVARSRAVEVPNVEFVRHGAEDIPVDPGFELVTTFDVIHDLADPMAGLVRIRAALRPDGQYLMMEPNASSYLENNLNNRAAMLYGVSALHCMTQSLAIGGEGLGAAWGREMAEDYAREAGFSGFQPLEDITNKFSAFYLLTP
jgi:SAM-dependent methyltransferase